ncbi:MAG: DPP IV N-terminal domain-containing protein, partial [Bacteroidetes bacterium]|nr:DPP IV N-terminal domain-containing protein [Bacteroidota bacterium]
MKYYLFLIVLFSQSFFSFSQSEIILSEIMKGKDFIGYWPENHFWHVKGEKIIFQWNPDFKTEASWYEHSLLTNKTLQVDEQDEYSTLAYDRSQADYNDQYSVVNGHLIRYDKKLKSFQKLYSTTDRLRNIQRLENPNKVAFQIGNNLFTYNRENGSFLQITDFKLEDEKKEIKESTYLNSAEEELFNFIKEEAEEKKTKVKSDRWNLNTHYLGKNNLVFLSLSPDEKMVYLGISTKTTTTNTIYSSYINEDGATKSNTARPKVGEAESEMKIFQFRLKDNKIELINLKSLSDYQRKPEYFKSYGDSNLFYFSDRLVYIHAPKFSNKSTPLFDIRSLDNKDRWIAAFDTQNNTLVEIDHQHDEAWIGGPGIEPWDVVPGTLNWINSSDFYFQSEESGFSQLYTYSFSTKSKTQLTKGNFEIRDAQLSTDKNSIYFVANKTHPGNRSFYQIDIKTKEWKTLWEQKGGIQPELSPDEKTIAALISTTNNPWELFTIQNKKATQITKSTTEAFKSISIADPKIISFKGQDNTDVFARVYSPTISSNKAAVIFVHGAGYLQNAHEYWSGYYREFLFHQLLINQGYTVLDIDYRASEGYG